MRTSQLLIWLDDERDPEDSRWESYFPINDPEVIWVKSYEEFVVWISSKEHPDAICFDHDLGDGPSGYDAAKWLTQHCLANGLKLPLWNIQSANPIGKENIVSLLKSFERIMES